jgi:hypothetical protein
MLLEKYKLANEAGHTMFVFATATKIYGHIIKDRTAKDPAKFKFETPKFDTVEDLKAEYPAASAE